MNIMNFAEIAMKFLLGLLAMVTIINMTGKGNLAPTSAMEQIMNYVLGGIIGVILGGAIGMIGSAMMGAFVYPPISGVLIALFFSLGIGLFFGYYPANKAAKLNPIDALRYE